MLAQRIAANADTRLGDRIVRRHDVSWAEYQRIDKARRDGSVPRLAYLDGVLELVSPSLDHEQLKSFIGRLVETWCLERGVEFSPYGSWTLKRKQKRGG